jgi:hypothetical protein
MRHALIPVHLIHSARTAAAASHARFDADPELETTQPRAVRRARRSRSHSRSRRFAARTRGTPA